jgi:hypothetical protein
MKKKLTTSSASSLVQTSNTSNRDKISLWINTDRSEYPAGQPTRVFVGIGEITDRSPPNFIRKISLEVRPENSNKVEYRAAKLFNARPSEFDIALSEPGTFNATVFTFVDGSMVSASTLFKVTDLFHTQTAIMIYVSIGFLTALLLLIGIGISNITIDEILRFIFISGIVGSILVGFLVTDKQFGIRSPIGLVVKPSSNGTGEITNSEWVLNIGGEPYKYSSGVQIPVYVLVIGLVGGYLRYLYKTSKLLTDTELIKERRKIKELLAQEHTRNLARRITFYESLKDLVLLFLSPLVAVASWFLISQWRPTENSVYLIGLICFSASLLTVEIVNSIIRFTKGYLKEPEASKQEKETAQANNLPEGAGDIDKKESHD